jgi:hypothetical protein
VVLEPLVSLEVTGLDQTGLFVLVPLDSEEILWYLVQEVSLQFVNFNGILFPKLLWSTINKNSLVTNPNSKLNAKSLQNV